MKLIIIILALTVLILPAHASFSAKGSQTEKENMDGRMLQLLCGDYLGASVTENLLKENPKTFKKCEHYMQGLVEASVFYERMMYTVTRNHLFCFPNKEISARQAILVTNEYLKKYPEKLDSRGVILVMESFFDTYTCGK